MKSETKKNAFHTLVSLSLSLSLSLCSLCFLLPFTLEADVLFYAVFWAICSALLPPSCLPPLPFAAGFQTHNQATFFFSFISVKSGEDILLLFIDVLRLNAKKKKNNMTLQTRDCFHGLLSVRAGENITNKGVGGQKILQPENTFEVVRRTLRQTALFFLRLFFSFFSFFIYLFILFAKQGIPYF